MATVKKKQQKKTNKKKTCHNGRACQHGTLGRLREVILKDDI